MNVNLRTSIILHSEAQTFNCWSKKKNAESKAGIIWHIHMANVHVLHIISNVAFSETNRLAGYTESGWQGRGEKGQLLPAGPDQFVTGQTKEKTHYGMMITCSYRVSQSLLLFLNLTFWTLPPTKPARPVYIVPGFNQCRSCRHGNTCSVLSHVDAFCWLLMSFRFSTWKMRTQGFPPPFVIFSMK